MKLSKTQEEVVSLMKEGWEMGHSMTMDGNTWIQKNGVGRGGECKTVYANTYAALSRKGFLECISEEFPTMRFHLKS